MRGESAVDLSVALLAISVAVVSSVLFVALPHLGGPSTMRLFLRFATGFFVCVVSACALYVVARTGGGVLFQVMGDTAVVLAPSLLFVGLCVLTERRALEPGVLAFALTVAVAVVSTTVPQPTPLIVRGVAVAVACVACAWAALRSPVEPAQPLRVIAVIGGSYAVYSLVRMLVGLTAGWGSATVLAATFFVPAIITGVVVATVVIACVGWLSVGRSRLEATRRRPAGTLVVVGDWHLASAAYGQERVRTLVLQLHAAARDLDPNAVGVARGVEVVLASPVAVLGARVRDAYGWSADEVALLSDGAPTGTVRLPIMKSRRPPRARSRRT